MGSGKTSAAIEMMNQDKENKYIYITPFLDEVQRIKQNTNRTFHEPKIHQRKNRTIFKHEAFHELLKQNKNIVSTHSLFSRANEETKELIYSNDYILILDEVMDVVEQIDLKDDDLETMLNSDLIHIDDKTGLVTWNEDKQDKETAYNHIKEMAKNKNIYIYDGKIFIWTFPVQVFKSFKDVYLLTYLFDAQIQKYYYDLHNLNYSYYHTGMEYNTYTFKEGKGNDNQTREKFKELINIYEGKLNKIGDADFSLSHSWYKKRDDSLSILKNNTENFFKNKMRAKSNETLWTTFKDYKGQIRGRGYTKSFIPINLRATNDWSDRKYLAYTVNRFLQPIINGFFDRHNVKVNQNLFALSEMLQWIYRSSIRNDEPIHIYIPSKRMRNLLYKWLNNEI